MASRLEQGFLLDRQWHWMRGEPETSKRPALLALARVLAEHDVPYAVIGGVALQVHSVEPRTTLDIDLAVADLERLPREPLERAGFAPTGRFAHSDNWHGPGGVPVQFTDDEPLREALGRAVTVVLEDVPLRVLAAADLVRAKLRAARDPARRRTKRLRDAVDVLGLLEDDPRLAAELTPQDRALLDSLPR